MASSDSDELKDINNRLNQIILDLQFGIVINMASDQNESILAAQDDLNERMKEIQSLLSVYGKDSAEMLQGIRRMETSSNASSDMVLGMLDRVLREINVHGRELQKLTGAVTAQSSSTEVVNGQVLSSPSAVNDKASSMSSLEPSRLLPIDKSLLQYNLSENNLLAKGAFCKV
jgi:hypothetical protein